MRRLPTRTGNEVKKFVVYANCQSSALGNMLLENEEFSSQYEWDRLPPVQRLKAKDIPEVLAKVRAANLFIYQPVAATVNRPVELSSAFLLDQVRAGTESVSFPSLYFDGYFPHLQSLMGYIGVLNRVHDYFIAYCCAIGLTVEKTVELMQKENLYPEELSLRLVERSLGRLAEREASSSVDIPLSGFIRARYVREKLFNQFNHPRRAVLQHVAEQILERMDIAAPRLDREGDSYLDVIVTPVYRSTYRNLKLEFAEEFDTYSVAEEANLKQEEIVRRFFDYYRSMDLADIKLHVSNTKPFVPRLVEAHLL